MVYYKKFKYVGDGLVRPEVRTPTTPPTYHRFNPPLSETDLEWYNLYMSDQYWELHETAFTFLRAYYLGNIETAKGLAADPDNDRWLTRFAEFWYGYPQEERSLDNIHSYFFSVNRHTGTPKYYEKDGEQIRIIPSYLNVSDAIVEMNYLIHLDTIYIDGTWKILDFAIDP
ncbi:MAG: hypothetical protein FWG87_11190 [Defluviitaleaceae bacterium]|nr:hypothetical protein [Defluviitaleaceae bacterium]